MGCRRAPRGWAASSEQLKVAASLAEKETEYRERDRFVFTLALGCAPIVVSGGSSSSTSGNIASYLSLDAKSAISEPGSRSIAQSGGDDPAWITPTTLNP
jgi:hypothetical protein